MHYDDFMVGQPPKIVTSFDKTLLELLCSCEGVSPFKMYRILEVLDHYSPEIVDTPELAKLRDDAYYKINKLMGVKYE